jgi:hypothetical protein
MGFSDFMELTREIFLDVAGLDAVGAGKVSASVKCASRAVRAAQNKFICSR